ncbi:MAG: DUF4381 family protein [Acidobacteria bacterium]|nr:DUF4381 family protein [Acidobacteriota bacterium]
MNLDQLADIVEPAQIPWTPQTIGWWLLLAAVVITIAAAAWRAHRHRVANAYRREALRELDELARPTTGQVNAILKRAAMVAYSRDEVATLTGANWATFLGKARGAPEPSEQVAAVLADGYGRDTRDGHQVLPYARQWLATHHRRSGVIDDV